MIDIVGAIVGTALYAALVGVLIGFPPLGGRLRLAAGAAAAGWGAPIVLLAALGGFAPGASGPVPGPGAAFATLLLVLFGGWSVSARFRDALLAVPLPALIGLVPHG